MGTTKSAISRLESAGKHAPSRASLKRYASAVGCELQVKLVRQKATLKPSGARMRKPVEILEAELLQLPKADRIRVIDRVVASLDADAARDAACDAVAARRDAEAERDPSVLLQLDDVLAKLRAEARG
jgi:transcriptional regulator with XRE-family HTH domain